MSWFGRRDRDYREELETHIQMEVRENIERGMAPDEARDAANRTFGNALAVRETLSEARPLNFWQTLVHDLLADLRFTFRLFHNDISFSLVAIGSIALGIGATSAIFSLIYAVLFDPYPYRDADRIIAPTFSDLRGGDAGSLGYTVGDFLDLRKSANTLEDAFLSDRRDFVVTDGLSDSVKGFASSPNFFDFMGVPALLGRTFGPGDVPAPASPPPIAVLSYLFWQRHFQADPGVVGHTIELNRQPYTILGVLPPRFTWQDADVYVPLPLASGSERTMTLMARIKPGLALDAAAEELRAMTERFAERSPGVYPKELRGTKRLNDFMLGRFRGTLLILLAAVGCLLLIAIGNVSILLLARASVRQKEVAVRLSLGASRGRVIRQLLTESIVLSTAGGLLGVLLAYRGVPAIVALMPTHAAPHEAVIHVNGAVVLFSFVISVFAGTLFGMAPALQLAKSDIRGTMAESGSALSGSGRIGRIRGMLIVSEVALTMVLLVGAGIAVRGLAALVDAPLGYDPSNVAFFPIVVHEGAYPTWQERRDYVDDILEKLRAAPGVESATASSSATPPWIGFETPFETRGQAQPDPNQTTLIGLVSGDYFSTLRVPLLRGRDFSENDFARVEHVAVLNEAMQRTYFPNEDPVGQRIRVPALRDRGDPSIAKPPQVGEWLEIIGVVGSARNRGLGEEPRPAIYIPNTLALAPGGAFMVRTAGDPRSLFNALRRQVLAVDDNQPPMTMSTLENVLASSQFAYPRFSTTLFTIFAVVGLLLAATGLYSVVSYTVTQRTQEFGIRMSLGAARTDILRLVGGMTAKLLLTGMAIGLAGSLALSRVIAHYVEGWDPKDPVAFAAVALLLTAVALAACWRPARRATRIQPVNALRHQ
jgi:predicted permease